MSAELIENQFRFSPVTKLGENGLINSIKHHTVIAIKVMQTAP